MVALELRELVLFIYLFIADNFSLTVFTISRQTVIVYLGRDTLHWCVFLKLKYMTSEIQNVV